MTKKKDTAFDFEFLEKLVIGIGEVSEITDIPTRQIRYWEDKGIVSSMSENGKNRRYNYKNIKKMILIKELLDEGFTLDTSAQKVEKRMKLIEDALGKLNRDV
ncbi:MAG: MerR family transcriptional regulator [Hyphomicrobiales bacterium]